jgi:CheY-like chemotaxis protein
LNKTKKESRPARVILVAEDEDDDFLLLHFAYGCTGLPHTLRRVISGSHVIQYLQACTDGSDQQTFPRPDLLLLDLKMPHMDGVEVLQWLRRSREWSNLPVVVLCGSNMDGVRETARHLGARASYTKAIELKDTQAMLKAICDEWLGNGADGERR